MVLKKTIEIKCRGAELVPLSSLVPFQGNLKDLSEVNYKKLRSEILSLGFSEPFSVWQCEDGKLYLLNGHQRHRVLTKMVTDEGYECPALPVSMVEAESFAQARKKVLALTSQYGQITGQGLYEFAIESGIEPAEIEERFQFPEINFDSWNTEFFKDPAVEPQCDEDEIPEHVEAKTKLGDIYRLGRHRLMCGDSTSIDAVEKLMAGDRAEMVFTDPPYGVSYQSNMRTKSKKFDVIENDETFLSEWVNCLPIVSDGWAFVWTSWKVIKKWIEITEPIGELSNIIIWDKGGGWLGDLKKTFSSDYEAALVFNRGAELKGKRIGSVWSVGKDRAIEYKHPTQKPVELGAMAIESCVDGGAKVLDLFGGSGSTMIACEKTGRIAYLMELDPKYCDVIVARWEKYTGKKAEIITNG